MTASSDWPERFAGHQYPQTIPAPDEIKPGDPAPWAYLSIERRANLSLELVTTRLDNASRLLAVSSPPVEPAELALVADASPVPIMHRSAVLVALFEEDGEAHVVLTRRSFAMRAHRGEIALPGGRSHGDETPVATALREAEEEVGLDPRLVTPLAWLTPISAFGSSSSIWPIVGVLDARPELTINPSEVDRAFTVALADLAAEGAFIEERWRRSTVRPGADEDGYYPLYFFKVPDDLIWGATARVLTELLSIVTGV
ncbi:MAG: CoA pyrophosphatase [Acidimicrobiales bacterium]